ncbi:MAG TPA: hypothetical protein VN688_11445 [Gemmataceae bacterium]|nr:hypothetical protein [Gemmataceae bacterium]
MADEGPSLRQAREELIRLIDKDEWHTTGRAEREGRQVLRRLMQFPTQFAVVRFALDLLKANYPMHAIQRGEPPGSLGVGYVMNVSNEQIQDLYIELIIEEDKVWVISFHISKHHAGG